MRIKEGIFWFVLGILFGGLIALFVTPWTGEEFMEKTHLKEESIDKKISKIKKEIERLEEEME